MHHAAIGRSHLPGVLDIDLVFIHPVGEAFGRDDLQPLTFRLPFDTKDPLGLDLQGPVQGGLVDLSVIVTRLRNKEKVQGFSPPVPTLLVVFQIQGPVATLMRPGTKFNLHFPSFPLFESCFSVKRSSTRFTVSTFFLSMILL